MILGNEKKQGIRVNASQPFLRISPDGSTLTVTATHTSDSGKYTCVATNQAGEEDRIFNLNVYGELYLYRTREVEQDFSLHNRSIVPDI